MQRTLEALKNQGFPFWKVEHWNPWSKQRQDMFHIIDVIALDHTRGVIGIQVCGSDFAAHWRKITEERKEETLNWLKTPGAILEIWAWRKLLKKRGGKATYWSPRIVVITLDDLET